MVSDTTAAAAPAWGFSLDTDAGRWLAWLTRATETLAGTEVRNVARPMAKYLAVLFATLMLLVFVPAFSLWLPRQLGL